MRYESPRAVDRARATELLASGDSATIRETIIGLTYHEPDWEWVEGEALRLTEHPDPTVRAVAATALGHLARLHGQSRHDAVRDALHRLRLHPATAGRAADALSDIAIFTVDDDRTAESD